MSRYQQMTREELIGGLLDRDAFGLGDRPLEGESHYDVFPEIGPAWRAAHRRGLAGEVLGAAGFAHRKRGTR